MLKDDLIRLRHMLDAAKVAVSFATGRSREDLNQDRMLTLSLVKDIEIIGEAANKVSKETRDRHTEIQWQDIIDMRNHLIHGYCDIDFNIVWDTANRDLPPLIASLEKIIPQEEK